MKSRMLQPFTLIFVTSCVFQAQTIQAKCIDVLQPGELPREITTQHGTTLTFAYQFEEDETYSISWAKGAVAGGPIGPFPLQPGCGIPDVLAESNEFILLQKGCGTFCWYAEVLGVALTRGSAVVGYERLWRPLAFDTDRNLLAYYPEKDVIAIRNLLSGYEQVFATERTCNTGSGLCFIDIAFQPDAWTYSWHSAGVDVEEVITQPLDKALLTSQ